MKFKFIGECRLQGKFFRYALFWLCNQLVIFFQCVVIIKLKNNDEQIFYELKKLKINVLKYKNKIK